MQEYQKLLYELREKLHATANKYIPKMYEALRKNGLTPKDARAQIEKDLQGQVSSNTISHALPFEAKNAEMSFRRRKGELKKKLQEMSVASNATRSDPIPIAVGPKGSSVNFNPNQPVRRSDIEGTILIDLERFFPELQKTYRSGTLRTWLAHNGKEIIAVHVKEADFNA